VSEWLSAPETERGLACGEADRARADVNDGRTAGAMECGEGG
jgi:hypothetical protein